MASLKLAYSYVTGQFAAAVADMQRPIARASSAAIKDAGARLKAEARADIGAAGFSSKWQNALRVDTFPKGSRPSIDAAAFLHHKIPYAAIFETGGTIRGKPFLWLPLKNVPKRIGRQRMTPALYREKVGPLRLVTRGGGPPLLVADQAKTRSKKTTLSISSLRRGAAGGPGTRAVPLFIGIRSVTEKKKFHIAAIAAKVRNDLPALYAANFKE